MPLDYIVGCYVGQENLPMGLFLAEDLKQKRKDNYLIVSAANDHTSTYRMLVGYAKSNGLNAHVKHDDLKSVGAIKSSPEYWEEVLKIIEDKNMS